MHRFALLTITILTLLLSPAQAGAGHDHHAGAQMDTPGAQCAAAIQNVARTVTPIDGGVRIEFRSRDSEALDKIARLAAEGKIFGPGPDGELLKRRLRRERRTVTVTAIADTTEQLQHVKAMAAHLDGPTPFCGGQFARRTPSPRQG